ncbi:MAG: HAMP domain-containing histidine kinase [Bacteroidales bacterium]|nr:HAMP domain-containing histidine kinase [Bacteroidales bacterium]
MKKLFTIIIFLYVTIQALANVQPDFSMVDSLYKAKDMFGAVKAAKTILEAPGDESKGAIYSLIAKIYSQAGNLTQAEKNIKTAINFLENTDDAREKAIAYGRASSIYDNLGNSQLASEYAEKGVQAAAECDDELVIASMLLQRSYTLVDNGETDLVKKDLEFADSVFRARNSTEKLAAVCYQIGQIYDKPGQVQVAIEYYRDAVEQARKTEDLPLLEKACRRLGFALHDQDPNEAYTYMKEAAATQEKILKEIAAQELALVSLEYLNLQKDSIIDEKDQQIRKTVKVLVISLVISLIFVLLLVELKRLVDMEKRKAKELSKLNDQKNLLFSIIAHDLRSPAIAQQAALKILSKNIDSYSKEEIAEIIKDMSMQSMSEVALIENILRWSRIKTRKGELQIARFSVPEALNELAEEFKPSSRQKEIQIGQVTGEQITLRSERGFIMLVLRNIISNAVKFTPRGGHIELSASAEEDGARISVKDDGIGMDRSTLDQLFQIQSQGSRKGTEGEMGSGFGLVVSMDLIHEIGGDIRVQSEVGKGSTFIITIPNVNSNDRKN